MRIPSGLANASIMSECSIEQGLIALALCKAQAEFKPVNRTLTGVDEFGNEYLYAGLDAMQDVYRLPLAKNGVCVDCSIVTKGEREAVQYKLTHAESGQWKASTCFIPQEDCHSAESKLSFMFRMRKPLIGMLLDLSSRGEVEATQVVESEREEDQSQTFTIAMQSIIDAPTGDRLDALCTAIKQRVKEKSLSRAQSAQLNKMIEERKLQLEEVTA